jgi:hypothetical protein
MVDVVVVRAYYQSALEPGWVKQEDVVDSIVGGIAVEDSSIGIVSIVESSGWWTAIVEQVDSHSAPFVPWEPVPFAWSRLVAAAAAPE